MADDEIVQKIMNIVRTHANPKQGLANLKKNQNIVPGIVKIIKNSTNQAPKVVEYASTNDIVNSISKLIKNGVKIPPRVAEATAEKLTTGVNQTDETVQKILKYIKNSLNVPIVVNAEARPEGAIGRVYLAGRKVGWAFGTPGAPMFRKRGVANLITEHKGWKIRQRNGNTNAYNFYYTKPERPVPSGPNGGRKPWSWPSFFSRQGKMPNFGPQGQLNFIAPTITGKNNAGRNTYNQTPPMPGYVLTTRKNVPGWYLNKTPVPTPAPGPAPGPSGPPRNYSKMSISELLKALRETPTNRSSILDALRKALERELRDAKYEYSRSRRVRKLGDLLRLLPRNYNGRRSASSMVVNDIRETRNSSDLSNLKSNLGSVPNENIRRAFDEQRRRLNRRRPYESENEYRSRVRQGGYGPSRPFSSRRLGESVPEYNRNANRRREAENANKIRRRREVRMRVEGSVPDAGGEPYRTRNLGTRGMNFRENVTAPPPLPQYQSQAINNAGGAPKAFETVALVPGGAPEVAKAAEALNETGGNVQQAIYIKGASPVAVAAVKNLGGPKNAVNVLEGLNTLSQTAETRKRKAVRMIARPKKRGTGRRAKIQKPRVAELNRVINAVKKKKLISLVAHHVTKTHNIHPNDEKLKKYYKKVLKANILRTPFAKIVKNSSKKK